MRVLQIDANASLRMLLLDNSYRVNSVINAFSIVTRDDPELETPHDKNRSAVTAKLSDAARKLAIFTYSFSVCAHSPVGP